MLTNAITDFLKGTISSEKIRLPMFVNKKYFSQNR